MMVAPMAPMAPAWLTVATPMMMEPSTTTMRASGGTRASSTRSAKRKSYLPSKCTGGASFGRTRATTRMYSMYRPTRIRPGRKAPRNMSPALAEVMPNSVGMAASPVANLYSALRRVPAWSAALDNWSARMIRTMDGGMI